MKKYLVVISLIFSMSNLSIADVAYIKGQVKNIRFHRAELPNWAPPLFWFTLEGVTSAGTCPQWHGNALFVGDSDQAMSAVLATYSSGKELAIRYDEDVKINGWCVAEYITLGNPPPVK